MSARSGTARRVWGYGGCGAKIGILPTPVDATTFPVDANDSEGRFELLSRIDSRNKIRKKIGEKQKKLDLPPTVLIIKNCDQKCLNETHFIKA